MDIVDLNNIGKIISLFVIAIFLYHLGEDVVIPTLLQKLPLDFAFLLIIIMLVFEIKHSAKESFN